MPESNNPTLAGREAPTVEGLMDLVRAAICNNKGALEACRAYAERLAGYRSPAEGWIAVSEKLPEGADAISCEAWCKAESDTQPAGPCVMFYDDDPAIVHADDRWSSREDTGCWEPGEVTHWRPRSAPPTGAAEGTTPIQEFPRSSEANPSQRSAHEAGGSEAAPQERQASNLRQSEANTSAACVLASAPGDHIEGTKADQPKVDTLPGLKG